MQWASSWSIGLALLSASAGMMAQPGATQGLPTAIKQKPLSSAEEADSYDIYSTVLQVTGPTVADWTIVRETRAFPMCLQPAADQESIYRPMIDDYALKNQKAVVLQRKFKLSTYTLVGPESWITSPLRVPNTAPTTNEGIFAVFSVVVQPRPDPRSPLLLDEPFRRYMPLHG